MAASQSQTRTLAAVRVEAKNILKWQHQSDSVINFWNNRGHWALGSKHDSCSEFVGKKRRRVCSRARRSLAFHQQRTKKLESSLVLAVARYADTRMVLANHSGSPLRQEMTGIVRASYQEGISPFFILAIAGAESTLAQAACGKNAWGWNRCSTNGWKTFAEGAREVARGLRVNYLGKWGSSTIAEVGYDYCGSGCNDWAGHVSFFMSSIFSAGNGMRWSDAVRTVAGP